MGNTVDIRKKIESPVIATQINCMSVKCIKANEEMCKIFCDDKDRNSSIKNNVGYLLRFTRNCRK